MRQSIFTAIMLALFVVPAYSQSVNSDSIKQEMEKIELSNPAMKQMIDRYKKGVIKGSAESMNLLGMECMSGKNVKANMEMGLNLLDAAAKQDYVEAQYNLANYFFIFWISKPANDGYFAQGTKWLKKAVKAGDNRSIIMLARFYYEYGRYKNEAQYIYGAIQALETYPKVQEVNHKDEQVLTAQAWLGTMSLGKWRMDNDTLALRDSKKWYKVLLQSNIQFPNYTQYIDSLQAVLSMGVPMRLDPMPTSEEIEASKNAAAGGMGGFGGFPGGGFPGGGFPGGGAPGGGGQPQGPTKPQATFPGGGMQMMSFIRSNTNYPENLKNQKINGSATVSFTIDTDGAVINPVISNNAEVHIMDKEALRTVMIMPDWIPAEQDGHPVKADHTANVSFGSGGMGGFGGFGF